MNKKYNRIKVFNWDFTSSDRENRIEKKTINKQKAERRLYRDKLGRWCKKGKGIQLNLFSR